MQSALDIKLTPHADVLASAVFPADKLSGRRVEAWRQRLVVLALVFSDVVLALDVWGLASVFHRSYLGGARSTSLRRAVASSSLGKLLPLLGDEQKPLLYLTRHRGSPGACRVATISSA